jgi:hypothetical protein
MFSTSSQVASEEYVSNVTWQQQRDGRNANVGNLKYWVRDNIANDNTDRILNGLFEGVRYTSPFPMAV